jgi:outer membrane protein insertion porin family
VRYVRTRADATKYHSFGSWIFSAHAEGGYIKALQSSPGPGRDAIRLTDRFFGPQLRGFDIRGIGPRVVRYSYNDQGELITTGSNTKIIDSLGGRAYYMGRLELEFPTSAGLRSVGLRPSAFIDVGSQFLLTKPILTDVIASCIAPVDSNGQQTGSNTVILPGAPSLACPTGYSRVNGFKEFYLGDSPKPRLSIGIGVNWTSPFGPLRLDLARAILKQKGDETKLFSFNVGTAF